jgi:hypothetical protein
MGELVVAWKNNFEDEEEIIKQWHEPNNNYILVCVC